MKRFIHIYTLTNPSCDIDFGYVARDIDTGETCYFTHYDEHDILDPENIYYFDPHNMTNNLAWMMENSGYPLEQIANCLHPEIIAFLDEAAKMHRNYNESHGYPINLLDFNKANLKVMYQPSYSIFGMMIASLYFPVDNRMVLYRDKLEYQDATKQEKQAEKSNIIHEIGHLKVSSYKIENNNLFIKTGFFPSQASLEGVTLDNGDILYLIKDEPQKNVNLKEKALEEIINDTDCSLVYPDFKRTYPNIGDPLNKLCDGILPKLRYASDAYQAYCDYLKRIIGSQDAVDEINGLIKDALFGRNQLKRERQVLKLINEYQAKKR